MKQKPFDLFLTLFGAAVGSCGGSTQQAGADIAFKTVSVDSAVAGAGVTNLLGVSFAAPSNGFVWASASGTCVVTQPLPIGTVLAAQIETSPTAADPSPGDGAFELGGNGAEPTMGAIDATRTAAVMAGANTLYLNINNPSSGGMIDCSATMIVVFSSEQLH
jgi:hypothetical protein